MNLLYRSFRGDFNIFLYGTWGVTPNPAASQEKIDFKTIISNNNTNSTASFKTSELDAARGSLKPVDVPAMKSQVVNTGKQLLPGEGKVGPYGKLVSEKTPGSNLAAHHMPNSKYMQSKGVTHENGISMLVEHPHPGAGGRHREIHKELIEHNPLLEPRQALAESLTRAREVYIKDGAYTKEVKKSLLEVIEKSKETFPDLFMKGPKS